MNSYSSKGGITILYQKYSIAIPSPYIINFKKFPRKPLVATFSKGKKINFPYC